MWLHREGPEQAASRPCHARPGPAICHLRLPVSGPITLRLPDRSLFGIVAPRKLQPGHQSPLLSLGLASGYGALMRSVLAQSSLLVRCHATGCRCLPPSTDGKTPSSLPARMRLNTSDATRRPVALSILSTQLTLTCRLAASSVPRVRPHMEQQPLRFADASSSRLAPSVWAASRSSRLRK